MTLAIRIKPGEVAIINGSTIGVSDKVTLYVTGQAGDVVLLNGRVLPAPEKKGDR